MRGQSADKLEGLATRSTRLLRLYGARSDWGVLLCPLARTELRAGYDCAVRCAEGAALRTAGSVNKEYTPRCVRDSFLTLGTPGRPRRTLPGREKAPNVAPDPL